MNRDDEKVLNIPTAIVTAVCIIAGVILITQHFEVWGGLLLSFATGAAITKPLIRGDN